MFKKSLLVIAALILVLGMASVSLGAPAFKIGVVTGTVSHPSSTVNRHTRRMKSPIARGEHKSDRKIEKHVGIQIDR